MVRIKVFLPRLDKVGQNDSNKGHLATCARSTYSHATNKGASIEEKAIKTEEEEEAFTCVLRGAVLRVCSEFNANIDSVGPQRKEVPAGREALIRRLGTKEGSGGGELLFLQDQKGRRNREKIKLTPFVGLLISLASAKNEEELGRPLISLPLDLAYTSKLDVSKNAHNVGVYSFSPSKLFVPPCPMMMMEGPDIPSICTRGLGKNAYDQNACDQNAYNKNVYDQNAYNQNAGELKCL